MNETVNVTVTSSIAGVVIPPRQNMILYSVAAGGASISQLFIAGIFPGILMSLCLAVVANLVAVKPGYLSKAFSGRGVLFASFLISLPGLFTAVINVGGVRPGLMSVTEPGAFGAICAILFPTLVYREQSW